MTIYQKSIRVRKECESRITCKGCNYKNKCVDSEIVFYTPSSESLKILAKAIKEEKWNVK